MNTVSGLKCNRVKVSGELCRSTSDEGSICKFCADVAEPLKFVKLFLENFQNIKGAAVQCLVCLISLLFLSQNV